MKEKNYLDKLVEVYDFLEDNIEFEKMALDNLPQLKSPYPEDDYAKYIARLRPAEKLASYVTTLSKLNSVFPELENYIKKNKKEQEKKELK